MMFKNKEMNNLGIFGEHGDEGHLIRKLLQNLYLREIYEVLISNNYNLIRKCFFDADRELKKGSSELNSYDVWIYMFDNHSNR